MAGERGGSWLNPLDNIGYYAANKGARMKGADPIQAHQAAARFSNTPVIDEPAVDFNSPGYQRELNAGPGNDVFGEVNGASTSTPVAVDPYAKFGGRAAYDAIMGTIRTGQGNARTGAETNLRDVRNTYTDKNNAFVTDVTEGQDQINRGSATNQLNLRTTMANIVRGIQSGIRSGGVALAGMNASDSGASDALARAYAKVGNTQTGEARGDAAMQDEELMRQQGQLNTKRAQGEESLGTWRDTETSRVRGDFSSKLDTLDAGAAEKGITGAVDRSIVDQVLGDALAKLAAIDASRQQRLSGVKQWSPEEIMAEALRMEQAGQAGTAFAIDGPQVNYGGQSLAGAPQAQLPIYVKGRDEAVLAPSRKDKAVA